MNPLTQIKNTQKISAQEILQGVSDSASWHARFKHSACVDIVEVGLGLPADANPSAGADCLYPLNAEAVFSFRNRYIFAGGLSFDLTEGDILAVFSQYGEIVDVNLVRDKDTGGSKGFCFIAYEDQRSTVLACDNLSGAKVAGRIIRVEHVLDYKVKRKEIEKEGGVMGGGGDMPIREAGPDAPGKWINSGFTEAQRAPQQLQLPEGATVELPGERGTGGGGDAGPPGAPARGLSTDEDALLAQLRARKLAAIQKAAAVGAGDVGAAQQQPMGPPAPRPPAEGHKRPRADDDDRAKAAKKAKKEAKKAKKAVKKANKEAKRARGGSPSSSRSSSSDSGRSSPPRGAPPPPRRRDVDRDGERRDDYRGGGRGGDYRGDRPGGRRDDGWDDRGRRGDGDRRGAGGDDGRRR